MDILKEKIVEFLKKSKCAKSFDILVKEFKIKSDDDKNILKECLKNLEIEGILYENKNHNYILLEYDENALVGIVKMRDDGDADILCGDKKVLVFSSYLDGVYNDDIVLVDGLCYDKNRIYGAINKVLKRKQDSLACVVITKSNGEKILCSYLSDIKKEFNIDNDYLKNFVNGEIVLLDLSSLKDKRGPKLTTTNKYKDDPDNDIYALLYNSGIDISYSEKYMKELEKIPTEVEKKSYHEGRKDLTNKNISTLDGIHTKDFDDAFGIEENEDGNFIIYSCKSDVPYYVKLNTAIFERAARLTSSIYLNNRVVHMLNPKISNGICSLNPCVDRLVRVTETVITKNGEIIDSINYYGIINSKKRMTYDDVNKILEDKQMISGYEPFVEDLKKAEIFCNAFEKKKFEHGYINLLIPETEVDGSKEDINVEIRTQRTAEKIIENIALLDNINFASNCFWLGILIGYRVHGKPDVKNIKGFLDLLNNLGYKFDGYDNLNSNKTIQAICKQIKKIDHYEIYYEMLLRCFKKAGYSIDNIGHWGLGVKEYAQQTSAIRRIIDLINMINEDLFNSGNFDKLNDPEYIKFVEDLTINASEKEKLYDECERKINLMRMAEHMENHIGEEFEAIITDINHNKITIKTDNYYIGQVKFSDLNDDYYVFFDKTRSICGRDNHISYHIGDRISVKVKAASKINMTTEFNILKKINTKQKVLQIS